MRSGCSLCSGSVEKFHGAKHQRVEKRKNNFLKDNYMLVLGAVLVVAFLMYRQSKK
jgi:hypothetical protein